MQPANPTVTAKPMVAATVELMGGRENVPRDHVVKVTIELRGGAPGKLGGDVEMIDVARKALAGFPPSGGEPDRRRFEAIQAKTAKAPVIGVQASVVWPGRPGDASIDGLRAALAGEGLHVTVRETRECTESGCASEAMVEWNRPKQKPAGWYTSGICGKHDYKTCGRCESVYTMSSISAAGQAPSLTCEVCGAMIIEWGGTKVWTAQLISRGDAVQ